jgi:predicted helicase
MVLLAYYIAAVNIENAFHDATGQQRYTPFEGICLTDTFQLGEADSQLFAELFPHNSARVEAQKKAPLRVIMGNPPYSIGQKSANDNAQNQSYLLLDARIGATYSKLSSAGLNKSLYDSYIKAFRWSSDRLDPERGGIICFVSNGAWLDGNSADGLRKSLQAEFDAIYVFNLRGNARTSGDLRQKEAGNVFGGGSRTPIAITLLVKKGTNFSTEHGARSTEHGARSTPKFITTTSAITSVASKSWRAYRPTAVWSIYRCNQLRPMSTATG